MRSRSRSAHRTPSGSPQLSLPLPADERQETRLRSAWRSARLPLPFEVAMQVPALAICLRCLGEARERRADPPAPTRGRATRRMALRWADTELALLPMN